MKKFIALIAGLLLPTLSTIAMAQRPIDGKVVEINGIAYRLMVYWYTADSEAYQSSYITEALVAPLSLVDGASDLNYSGDVVISEDVVEYEGYSYKVLGIERNCFADCEELESVTISLSGELSSYSLAFPNCPKLTKIRLERADDCLIIESNAISDCPNLKELIISPKTLKLETHAIESTGLETLELPEGLWSMGNEALCLPSLKELICRKLNPKYITIAGKNPFGSDENGINLKECVLRVPASSVAAYKAADYWKEFGQILPIGSAGISEIESDAEPTKEYDLLGRPASGKGLRICQGKKVIVR